MPSPRTILLAICLASLAACESIQTEPSHHGFSLRPYRTYRLAPHATDPDGDGTVAPRVVAAIESSLADFGVRPAEGRSADLEVGWRIDIRELVEAKDPYFDNQVAALYEEGSLTLEFFDPKHEALLWSAVARARLREVGRSSGVNSPKIVAIEAGERRWRIEDKVRAIFEHVSR